MTPREAVAVLRRLLGRFQGERRGSSSDRYTVHVAEMSSEDMVDALNALAAIERAVTS
ncbi:hypothetical protein [Actinomycetospora termitidis]|uniref:Uncharacterized protein n=1 Tax=Actinomycetospora termitidis TaxID=3053470 RepID=A0ABT7MFM6_9PSEU|nr:hypothetical protein [Actinomycetospora sp. Odt1-22]MDL5159475.1 hypothetical protein [Actinomycetospora sp. Odt1-22]